MDALGVMFFVLGSMLFEELYLPLSSCSLFKGRANFLWRTPIIYYID
jgi:hypothetical protein